jgi:2'-5' RNA ligase
MAKHAVIMRFNGAAEKKLEQLKISARKGGAVDGTEGWPGHITLGAYEDADEEALCLWTKALAEKQERFRLKFASLGVFHDAVRSPDTDVIYAVPTAPKTLTDLYNRFHDRFDEFSGAIGRSYASGQPAMHATIIICKSADFSGAFLRAYAAFAPFEAIVTALEVYSLPRKLVARYGLSPPKRVAED